MKKFMEGMRCCLITLLILGLMGVGIIASLMSWLFS